MKDPIEEQIEAINNLNPKFKHKLALNQKEFASILGVSESTLSNWRESGIGAEYIQGKTRGKVLYTKKSIALYLIQSIKTA